MFDAADDDEEEEEGETARSLLRVPCDGREDKEEEEEEEGEGDSESEGSESPASVRTEGLVGGINAGSSTSLIKFKIL